MNQILTKSFFSSGINTEFNSIISIEVEDKPFAEGGFGEVYHCISINGNSLKTPQVVKIFKESFAGAADDNLTTINRLQKKLFNLNLSLKKQGKNLLVEYPAFNGAPQFSFSGLINGKQVKGYSANNLTKFGFYEFEKILSNSTLTDKFYNIPAERRIYFAFQLVSAFKVLDEFKYIHADLKPGAIFLNLDTQELALIDYDSGVITENSDDEPQTWGALGDWVAPEIYDQQIVVKPGTKIKVDSFTDRWSVAIGINYLISGLHPLFFLTELGPRITKMYFETTKWPDAEINAPYFCKDNQVVYNQYLEFISTKIPSQIKEKIANTINFGYRNSVARTTYKDWEIALKSIQQAPVVTFFSVSKNDILEGEEVYVAWKADNAISVEIFGVGVFSSIDKKAIKPTKSTNYKFSFKGYYGTVSKEITINVTPAPKFKKLLSDKNKIKKGESTILVWEIENISEARLTGVEKESLLISKNGQQNIKPEQTTIYKFELTALDGKTIIEKFVTVEVFEEGQITFFKADRQFVYPTVPVVLSWEVANALKVEIDGLGQFQLTGQTTVQPTQDTSYKIIVTDNFETLTKIVQIKMLPLPLIERISITPPNIVSSSTINISLSPFSTSFLSKPIVKSANVNQFKINLDSNTLIKKPKVVDLDFKIENVSFLKRLKKVYKLLQSEFTNEINKNHVVKK